VPAIALYLIFIPLLLPEGRLPSARWRPVLWLCTAATALLSVVYIAQPGRLFNFYFVLNPLAVGGSLAVWLQLQNFAFAWWT
jgi:hypothetical protein